MSNKNYYKSAHDELTDYAYRKIKKLKLQQTDETNQNQEIPQCATFSNMDVEMPMAVDTYVENGLDAQFERNFTVLQNDQENDSIGLDPHENFSPDNIFSDDDSDKFLFEDKKFKAENILDLLNINGFGEIISTPVNVSQSQLLLMLLKFSVVNVLPQTTKSNLFRLINSIFKEPVLPQSKYLLNKLNQDKNTVFHVTCPVCTGYVNKLEELNAETICANCKIQVNTLTPSCDNLFAVIDPSIAIAELLNTHEDYYDNIIKKWTYNEDHIRDIYDGKLYTEFLSSLSEENRYNYVTTTFNSDGAAPFKSSSFSLWPIYLMVNELPVKDRFNNLIPCLLWFNKDKPNMSVFLKVFVEMMEKLKKEGIRCTIKGEDRNVKVFALLCCVDSVARSPMQGHTQFNGKHGCNWCLHPTEWVNGSTKYPLMKETPRQRNHQSHVQKMYEVVEKKGQDKTENVGIKRVSPLINLPNFDIILGFVPEYMHCILSGVGKQITEYLIRPDDIIFFQKYIDSFKVPHQITRLTRPLTDRNYWKAREWENWILYYSLPLFSLRLGKRYIVYWSLLVESLYILLQDDITKDDLDRAERMLHLFVSKTQEYFSSSAMTFNVHQLLHICDSVINWGPLWAHSAFAFESGNHTLLQAIKSAKGVTVQIIRFINLSHTVSVLEKRVMPAASEVVKTYCYNLLRNDVKKCVKISTITYFGKGLDIENSLKEVIRLSANSKSYLRMVKDGCLYASYLKSNKRSNNSMAKLFNGNYVRIKNFIVDITEKIEVTICNLIKVSNNNFSGDSSKIKRICTIQDELLIVPTNEINSVCVYIKAESKEYICAVPNLHIY